MNTAFNQEQQIVSALMSTYQTWQSSIVSNGDLNTFVNNELTPTNPFSIVKGLLSGNSVGISKDLSTTSPKFSELGSETKSLADGLAKLANSASSATSRRHLLDLTSPQSMIDALSTLSNKFNTFSDKVNSIAATFSSLASDPLLKTLASIIQLTFKSLSTRFDNIFNDIVRKYVQPLIDKVKTFATAAQKNLATFQNTVGDYLNTFLSALSAIDLCSHTLVDLFNDMASHTSGTLSSLLTGIATVFQDIRDVESTIAYYLNFLTQFFPSPTSTLKLSLGTISTKLSALSISARALNVSVESIATLFNDTVIKHVHDFEGYLSQVAVYADELVPIFTTVQNAVSILSPLFKTTKTSTSGSTASASLVSTSLIIQNQAIKTRTPTSSGTTSPGSLASSMSAFLNKCSAVISKVSSYFAALTTSASSSLSSFISKMTSLYVTVKNAMNSIVTDINSIIELFNELIALASVIPDASTYLSPVSTNLNALSAAVNEIPEYLNTLPQLLLSTLTHFKKEIFSSTLSASHDAFVNISTTALTLSKSTSSFSHLLPSPFSIPLSPPFHVFSQICSQLSTISATLGSSLKTLIASSDFSVLCTVLSVVPPAQQLIDLWSKINSYLVYAAEQLGVINVELNSLVSGDSFHRGRALLSLSFVSSIQDTLNSLFTTFQGISTEFLTELNSALTISQDISNVIITLIDVAKGLQPPLPQLPKTITNILTTLKSSFSTLNNKIGSFISAFSSLSSPLSASNPAIMNVISNVTDISSTAGELSSSVTTFESHLPSYLVASLASPMKDLSDVCHDMQTYTALLASTLSYVSANPALNLIASLLPANIMTPITTNMETLAFKLSPLTTSLSVLDEIFSLSPKTSNRYLLTISAANVTNQLSTLYSELNSASTALQNYLSTIAEACGLIQKLFSSLSNSASSLSSDIGSALSTISTTAGSFSLTASSLGASISSLLTALQSSTYTAVNTLDTSFLKLSTSALDLSTSLVALNQSLPNYFYPSLSPVLSLFIIKLNQLSVLIQSMVALCSGPLTSILSILSLIPGADSLISDAMNTLSSSISILSTQLYLLSQNDCFIGIQTSSSSWSALAAKLASLYTAVTSVAIQIQPGEILFSNAVQAFVSMELALPLSQDVSPVFQKLLDSLTLSMEYVSHIASSLQSLASPFSTLSPSVSEILTDLRNITSSAQSIAGYVNTVSRNFSGSPYALTLPLLAQNLTQLSGYATSVITAFDSLSISSDLSLIASILLYQFPVLNANFTSVAKLFDGMSSYFASLDEQLSSTVKNGMAFLSTLLVNSSGWSELDTLAWSLIQFASTLKLIDKAVSSISATLENAFKSVANFISFFAMTATSVVDIINVLQTEPTSSLGVSKYSLSLNKKSNRVARCTESLIQFRTSSKQLLDANIDLLESILRPLSRIVSPPLEHLSATLNSTYETSSIMISALSTLITLSSLLPVIAGEYAESVYSSFDALVPHLVNIATKMTQLSFNLQKHNRSVIAVRLREYSNTLRPISSELISSSDSVAVTVERLSSLSSNIHSIAHQNPVIQGEFSALSRTASKLSRDFRGIVASIHFLTSPLSYFSPAMSALITNLANISALYSFNGTVMSFSQQSNYLYTGLTVLSASPLLMLIPQLTSASLFSELSSGVSHTSSNVTALRSLKHLTLTSDRNEDAVLVKAANSMTRMSKLLSLVAKEVNTTSSTIQDIYSQAFSLSTLVTSVAALFQSTSRSAFSMRTLLMKLPTQTRRALGRVTPATGVLFALMEKEILLGSSMSQDVPGYTFGNQKFEGPDPEDWATFYSTLESECDLPTSLDGSTPITYAAICQKRVAANSADIPGGFQASSADSIMGFLEDASKVLTFSANAPMSLSWSSAVSGSVAYQAQYDYSADDDMDNHFTGNNDIFGLDVELETNNNFNIQPSLKVHVGKHISNQHSNVRTVSVKLGDPDNGMDLK